MLGYSSCICIQQDSRFDWVKAKEQADMPLQVLLVRAGVSFGQNTSRCERVSLNSLISLADLKVGVKRKGQLVRSLAKLQVWVSHALPIAHLLAKTGRN
jgi:hypothetical protein